MADGEEEVTSGGGFEVVVRRAVFKTRAEAKVAACKKTIRNMDMAIEKAGKAMEMMKVEVAGLKKDLAEAKKGLKFWEKEHADTKDK